MGTHTDNQEYITPTALSQDRGWKPAKVKEILGEPDKTFAIRGSRTYAYGIGSLYAMARVLAAEQLHGDKLKKSPKRCQAGKAAAEKKLQEIIDYVNSIDIVFNVPADISLDQLGDAATRNRNQSSEFYPSGDRRRGFSHAIYANGDWKQDYCQRWIKNYLRHSCTTYEQELEQMYGKVGNSVAYEILKTRINNAAEIFLAAKIEMELDVESARN
jgi:hypothetical protein